MKRLRNFAARQSLAFIQHPESSGRNSPDSAGFHGGMDSTLPIDTTRIYFPPNDPSPPLNYRQYHSESHCLLNGLTYTLHPNITGSDTFDLIGAGSLGIYHIFHKLNKSVELYVDCDAGHGIDTITDNYGLPNITNTDSVYKYIVQRATTFFQAVLTGKDTLLGIDSFYDCVNERVRSSPNSYLADTLSNCPRHDSTCNSMNIDADPRMQSISSEMVYQYTLQRPLISLFSATTERSNLLGYNQFNTELSSKINGYKSLHLLNYPTSFFNSSSSNTPPT